ncbi:MAG: STAS domain-containing protein [Sulfuricella sp.]|nr:STAS domain-containing protein [Sulfuricella sp.]
MIVPDGDNYRLQGRVTIDNAPDVLAEGLKAFDRDGVVVDLSELEEVDSSTVSLLLEWLRAARRSGRKLGFVNLPANLVSLATLYGVLEMIQPG